MLTACNLGTYGNSVYNLIANKAANPRGLGVELADHRAVREYRRKISSQRKVSFLTIIGLSNNLGPFFDHIWVLLHF